MLGHQLQQRARLERLDQIISGALTDGIYRPFYRAESRHQQYRQLRITTTDLRQQLMTIHTRHVDVADHQPERLFGQRDQGRLGAIDRPIIMPAQAQGIGQGFAQRAIVFNQQDFGSHGLLLIRVRRCIKQRQRNDGAGATTCT